MKKISVLVALLAFSVSARASYAGSRPLWDCQGDNVEGAGIWQEDGKLKGSLQWDCFPGGGICNAGAEVKFGDKLGDSVFRGSNFWLIIHTSVTSADGAYKAHLIAKDGEDAGDMGRGAVFNEFLTCSKGK